MELSNVGYGSRQGGRQMVEGITAYGAVRSDAVFMFFRGQHW